MARHGVVGAGLEAEGDGPAFAGEEFELAPSWRPSATNCANCAGVAGRSAAAATSSIRRPSSSAGS